jgi:hypothetical protein
MTKSLSEGAVAGQRSLPRPRALTRKTVLVDLADLTAWLGQPDWRGQPIYLMAMPVNGLWNPVEEKAMNIMMEDDDADAWPILATLPNIDELIDEVALAARESNHGKTAYTILRRASGDTVPPLEGRLRLIDARNSEASP